MMGRARPSPSSPHPKETDAGLDVAKRRLTARPAQMRHQIFPLGGMEGRRGGARLPPSIRRIPAPTASDLSNVSLNIRPALARANVWLKFWLMRERERMDADPLKENPASATPKRFSFTRPNENERDVEERATLTHLSDIFGGLVWRGSARATPTPPARFLEPREPQREGLGSRFQEAGVVWGVGWRAPPHSPPSLPDAMVVSGLNSWSVKTVRLTIGWSGRGVRGWRAPSQFRTYGRPAVSPGLLFFHGDTVDILLFYSQRLLRYT